MCLKGSIVGGDDGLHYVLTVISNWSEEVVLPMLKLFRTAVQPPPTDQIVFGLLLELIACHLFSSFVACGLTVRPTFCYARLGRTGPSESRVSEFRA